MVTVVATGVPAGTAFPAETSVPMSANAPSATEMSLASALIGSYWVKVPLSAVQNPRTMPQSTSTRAVPARPPRPADVVSAVPPI